jgi:PKD repeat protein
MKKILLLFLALMLNSVCSYSQETTKNIENIFAGKKEVYFKFNISSRQEIGMLTKIISIDNVTKNNVVYAYANKKEFAQFLSYNYQYTLLINPGDLDKNPAMFDIAQSKQTKSWNSYPTYSAYEAMMYQFATDHPTLCQTYNIKTLSSGRKLLLVKISHNINVHENEPQFLYTSTIHGNETSGYIHMLHLIDTLLTSYGTNARITNILDNTELWICPLANPDGTYGASGGSSISGATRENANSIDLNRNYPDPIGGQHPDGNAWQPETQAFMGFADTMNFVMSANFHEGAEVCNYPWDGKAALTADDNWWQLVSNQFADTAQTYGPSGFFTDVDPTGITDGYAWYQVFGGRQDYMNYYQHCREETIEISGTQSPSGSSLPILWKGCKRSLLNYIEQSLKGIRGVVTDSCTGQGIRAFVSITGHDHDSSQIYSALPVGNYHRPIYAGTYNVTFSATGYQSRTINNITVNNGGTVVKNIALIPLSPVLPVAGFSYTAAGLTYNFTNTSSNGNAYSWDFGDGANSTSQNPSHIYATTGSYNVQLIVTNNCGSDTITEQVSVSTGINDPLNNNEQWNIFPNPTSGKSAIILTSDANDEISLDVYDLLGNNLHSEDIQINKGKNQFLLNLSDLDHGIYYVRIKSSFGNSIISKVIKL